MPELIFHPDIQYEIRESYQWYESRVQGLGEDFLNELESAFQVIKKIPDAWPLITKNFRRYLLDRFPFGIIYQKKENSIYIVAVMHLSRKPGYWLKRTDS
jgi:toxin ParE1/3/4